VEPSSPSSTELRRAKPALGTLVEMSVIAPNRSRAFEVTEAAFAEILRVHRLMSFHEASSDLSRLNRATPGDTIELDPQTAEVLSRALEFTRLSEGVFDCTIGTELVSEGLLPRPCPPWVPSMPAPMPVVLHGNRATKRAPCLIDLGGIAKGFAVDRAIGILVGCGIESALVNAGGDLRHVGPSPVGVHIRDPRCPSRIAAAIEVQNEAVASSATGGLPLWDSTGSPKSALWHGRMRSPLPLGAGATIVAPTCLAADALTKVVLATRNATHPLLPAHGARTAFHVWEQ
jgi:thiamine biosynthesis lipoprotein